MNDKQRRRCECGHARMVHGDLHPMCLMPDCRCQCFVTSTPKLLVLDTETLRSIAHAC